jgi:hypothetical protein
MWAKRMLTLVLGASVLVFGGIVVSSASAAQGDGTEDVADVRAVNLALLNPDGTLTVSVRVRCDPGWVFQEVSVVVDQGPSVIADGITSAPVPCDGRWHRVQFDLVTRVGTFEPGKVTFSLLQFGVTNEVTGDFEGVNDNGATARLRLAG